MVFIELWNYLHDAHRAIQEGLLRTQADTINRLFWLVNAYQYQQFPALLCAQAAWIFGWYLEKVLPFQEYAETDRQEIAEHYQLLITHLEQSAVVSQNIGDEFRREISRLQCKKFDRLHEVLDEYVKENDTIRSLLEYVLHSYFASKAILVDTFGYGILVPLQISVDPHISCEHVEFWNCAVDTEMQTSADAARSVARRYLLEQFDRKIPEDIAVQCQFFNPAVSYQDSSASLLIGVRIVGEVLGLEHDPTTAVTGEVEPSGKVLGVGNISQKIEAVGQDDGINRILIPAANIDEIQRLVQESQLTIISVRTFSEAIEHYYGKSQILECKRQQTLTWQQVREICADITKHRMATVQGKYEMKLYLQREKTHRAFEQFLHSSEKKCFVLIGKSGVGKSNFFLSLYDEFQRSQDDTQAMLMYDGANLTIVPSITTCITQDLNDRLKPPNRQLEDVWQTISRIEGIEDRSLILYLDAINENPNAKELLRQVNELVQKPYSWLKVVCSSRPETWQTIKRGVRLAERLYYREEESKTIGVELEPFFYSKQIEPFSRQELPEVYAKYQQTFNVQTPYEALQSEQRELLRDPLSL
jgi:GTPase SAR1 family protein